MLFKQLSITQDNTKSIRKKGNIAHYCLLNKVVFVLGFLQNAFGALLLLFEKAENSFLYFLYNANTKATEKMTHSPWTENVN